jgi:hypothetical protein
MEAHARGGSRFDLKIVIIQSIIIISNFIEILMTMKQKKAEESLRQNEPQISEVGTDGGDDRRSVERSDRRRRSRSQGFQL